MERMNREGVGEKERCLKAEQGKGSHNETVNHTQDTMVGSESRTQRITK